MALCLKIPYRSPSEFNTTQFRMGFPMIQVFMIAARQVSKPVADAVIKYGKDHPVFRTKLLIPIGRAIVRLTTRLRMKRLGLGEATTTNVQVSEAAALEQASDFVQQVVLFSYSLGVFASYYFYTQVTAEATVKQEEFGAYKEETNKTIEALRLRLEELEKAAVVAAVATTEKPAQGTTTRFPRISSLPVDSAVQLLVKNDDTGEDQEFVVVRRGTSIGIELADVFHTRGEPLTFRIKDAGLEPKRNVVTVAEHFARCVLGYADRV